LEQMLLDFGGPPKTGPSGRRDEHQDAHLADVSIERGAQCGRSLIEPLMRRRCSLRPAAGEDEQQDQPAEQLDRLLHGNRLHYGTKKGSTAATSVTASETQSVARTLRPVLTLQAAPEGERCGQYERQNPIPSSPNEAARKYGRYATRP